MHWTAGSKQEERKPGLLAESRSAKCSTSPYLQRSACSTNWTRRSRSDCVSGNVLQRLRLVLSEAGNVAIPPPAQKTFDAEGEILEHALTKSLRIRNDAIRSLCSSVRRFRDATIKEECRRDYPHALQALWKALDRAEDLIRN
jgi:hypothetical protein